MAALVVFFTGLVAWVLQLFGQRRDSPGPGPASNRRTTMRTDDVIDVVTTKVPDDTPDH